MDIDTRCVQQTAFDWADLEVIWAFFMGCVIMQVDGGRTFTEPSAIISGEVEKQKEVSCLPVAS